MTKNTETDKALTAAAQVRALLSSYLNRVAEPVCTDEIFDTLIAKFEDLKVSKKTVSYYLKELTDNGMILCTRDGVRNFYVGKTNKLLKPTKSKVDVKIRSLKEGKIPSYKIDVVKGQQRIRITMADVMFDIGVVGA